MRGESRARKSSTKDKNLCGARWEICGSDLADVDDDPITSNHITDIILSLLHL
jgi:hypothetical protein